MVTSRILRQPATHSTFGTRPPRPRYLTEDQVANFRRFASRRSEYQRARVLFDDDIEREEALVQLAASLVQFEVVPLDVKIKELTGYSKKEVDAFRKKLLEISAYIERLNRVAVPDGRSFVELLLSLGRTDVRSDLLPMPFESTLEMGLDFDRLPSLLTEYSLALRGWPHPAVRGKLSDRNWQNYALAQLCSVVRAYTTKNHFSEIAILLRLVTEFITEPKADRVKHYGRDEISKWSGELVSKNVKNFRKHNEEVSDRIDRLAQLAVRRNFGAR